MKSKTPILIVTLIYTVVAQDPTKMSIEVSTLPAHKNATIVANLTTLPTSVSNVTATTNSDTPIFTSDDDTFMTMTIGYSSKTDISNSTRFEKSTTEKYTTTKTTARPLSPPFPNNVGSWVVNGTLNPCIKLTGALQLHIISNVSNTNELSLDVPSIAGYVNVSGICKPDEQQLTLNWTTESVPKTLRFQFKTQANNKYAMSSVEYFNDSNKSLRIDGPFFQTSLNHSYRCTSNQQARNDKTPNFYILMEKFQFEAFIVQRENMTSVSFSSSEDCSADHRIVKGVILGLVAGAGLSAIVGVVFAVYICRRYRQGYQPLNDDTVIVS